MRIVGEVWRSLLSISRSKHFVSGRKDIVAERVTICIYCSISVQQMLAMQGIHSICSDRGGRVHRGRAAEHGARLSCKPRRRVLSSEHSVRSGDGSHPTPTPGTRSNPQPQHFHLATIIDTLTESSVCCEICMVLLILDISSYNYHVKILQ